MTVILWFLTSASVTLNRPSFLNWNVYVSPGFRIGAVNGAFFEMGWRFLVSAFVHVIESPASIVIAFGTKPALVMLTVFVAASACGRGEQERREHRQQQQSLHGRFTLRNRSVTCC